MNQEDFDLLLSLSPDKRLDALASVVNEYQTFTSCCICFEEVPDHELFLLPCDHGGCDECMLQFLNSPLLNDQEKKKCPICRIDIDFSFMSLGDVIEELNGLSLNSSTQKNERPRRGRPPRRNRRVLPTEPPAATQPPVEEKQEEEPQQVFQSPITRRYHARNASVTQQAENLQDLYETMERDILPLVKLIQQKMPQCFITDDNNRVFEPCCGNGAISNVLKILGYRVIERDLYTRTPVHDFLHDAFPEESYDFLITNPPYNGKKKFFAKALETGKPFAMFLPIETMFLAGFSELIVGHKVLLLSPNKTAKFLRNGEYKHIGNVVWFLVDFPFLTSDFTIMYYSNIM